MFPVSENPVATHREKGAVVAESVEEAVAAAQVVVAMLFDTRAVREAVLEPPCARPCAAAR